MEDYRDQEEERLGHASEKLRAELLRRAPENGIYAIPIGGAGIARRDQAGVTEHRFDRPVASLLAQGRKETSVGAATCMLEPGDILTVSMDMPSSSRIIEATPQKPLLTFFFQIDRRMIKDLLPELPAQEGKKAQSPGVAVARAEADFVETALRFLHVVDRPEQLAARGRLALEELHYLLLTGPQSAALEVLYGNGRNGAQLFAAIEYLKGHLDATVSAKTLARVASMSESTLYRSFRFLTGLSPLQYHKQLRLHEARRLMLSENESASGAAWRTGYESVSQFNREYRRLFGDSPAKSVKGSFRSRG